MLLGRKALSTYALTFCPITFIEWMSQAQGEAIPETVLLTGRVFEKQCEEETFHVRTGQSLHLQ